MQPLLYLSCADEARRAAIAEALQRGGLELADSPDELATVQIRDDAEGLLIQNDDDILIQLSVAATPDDVADLARISLELMALWRLVRLYEDSESIGVTAVNIANEARNALLPVMFAAEALALSLPAARALASLIVDGCKRASSVLERIAPSDSVRRTCPTCANTVISELAGTLRLIAHQANLAIRLDNVLPPVAIDRAALERMVLTLVANAADAPLNSERIVVATSSRTVTASDLEHEPAGDWVVVDVEDDGDRALEPTFAATSLLPSSGLGLPSIAALARSAGGHITVDILERGTRIRVWLPPVHSA
jgi:nitrogen-specific signal transduction histidine kinase